MRRKHAGHLIDLLLQKGSHRITRRDPVADDDADGDGEIMRAGPRPSSACLTHTARDRRCQMISRS